MFLRINPRVSLGLSIILLFFFLSFLQFQILAFRGLPGRLVIKPGEFAVLVALGGLRGVAADLLYLKADEFWQEKKWKEMLPLYRAITVLQPHYVDFWSNAGFHLAWNLSFASETQQEKEKYMREGIEFFKEGIIYNPDVYKLYFDIAFTYDHKLKNYDQAINWYRKAVQFPEHPTYIERLIAHALKKGGDLEAARQEWLKLQKLYPDDPYHQEIVGRNLKIVEEEIQKGGQKK